MCLHIGRKTGLWPQIRIFIGKTDDQPMDFGVKLSQVEVVEGPWESDTLAVMPCSPGRPMP